MLIRSLAAFVLVAASASCATAHAPPEIDARIAPQTHLAEVEIIDRTTGARQPIHWHQGKRWVAGRPGSRYAVAIRNASGGRVLAVLAVDGINAVTGETAAWDQNGYVFSPWQRWEIRGWRKSQERVAAFEFTALANSYAARTGRPDHVGVIGVALFRERLHAAARPMPLPRRSEEARSRDDAPASKPAESESASPSTPPSSAPSASGRAADRLSSTPESRLGTGHGRSEHSWVTYTNFERAQRTPDEVITIHYDSRENLIAMGVIPAPSVATAPNPFPGNSNFGFVPDPPR